MRTLIAIPCMDALDVRFVESLTRLEGVGDVDIAFQPSSLIYHARNHLAMKAIEGRYDYTMWLDSDMVFEPDLMERLSARLDEGHEFVSGVYYTRKKPSVPVILSRCRIDRSLGVPIPDTKRCEEIPEELFEIEGCGFGCVMMTTKLIEDVMNEYGLFPFYPQVGFGEDLAFCLRVRELGRKIMCDGTIRCRHTGFYEYSEKDMEAKK